MTLERIIEIFKCFGFNLIKFQDSIHFIHNAECFEGGWDVISIVDRFSFGLYFNIKKNQENKYYYTSITINFGANNSCNDSNEYLIEEETLKNMLADYLEKEKYTVMQFKKDSLEKDFDTN